MVGSHPTLRMCPQRMSLRKDPIHLTTLLPLPTLRVPVKSCNSHQRAFLVIVSLLFLLASEVEALSHEGDQLGHYTGHIFQWGSS